MEASPRPGLHTADTRVVSAIPRSRSTGKKISRVAHRLDVDVVAPSGPLHKCFPRVLSRTYLHHHGVDASNRQLDLGLKDPRCPQTAHSQRETT